MFLIKMISTLERIEITVTIKFCSLHSVKVLKTEMNDHLDLNLYWTQSGPCFHLVNLDKNQYNYLFDGFLKHQNYS